MHVETEIKLKVETHDAVRKTLIAGGAQHRGSVLERNCIFDRPDRSLLDAGTGLRVRSLLEIDGKRGPTGTLTFKGPRQPGRVKSRQELEVEIGSAETTCAILEALGYAQVVSFDKRRETWDYKDCQVELDELPHLGCYVEIEGPTQATVESAETALNLDSSKTEERTYIAMLVEYCTGAGRSAQDIRFGDGNEQR